MYTQTVHVEPSDLVTVLDEIRRAPLDHLVTEDLDSVIRRIVSSDAEKVPSVPIAAFSSAI